MSEENLGETLDEGYREHAKAVAIQKLGERMTLSLAQIAELVANPKHGDTVKTITLQDLVDVTLAKRSGGAPAAAEAPKRGRPAKSEAPKAAKKTAKKAPAAAPAKKTAKKAAAAPKKAAAAKADKGSNKKPRLNYEQGCKEVVAVLKAAPGPVGRGEIEKATSYTGVQVRAFCKQLVKESKIKVVGKGGRSTKYTLG